MEMRSLLEIVFIAWVGVDAEQVAVFMRHTHNL